MAIFTSTPVSIVDPSQQSAGSAKAQASNIDGSQKTVQDPTAARLFKETAAGFNSVQQQIDQIMKALRADIPQPPTIGVTDPKGNLIAWIGYQVINNVVYQGGWFKQIYIGGVDAAHAVIASDVNGNVTITGAEIVLNGSGATITLDPNVGQIVVAGNTPTDYTTRINDAGITIDYNSLSPAYRASLNAKELVCGVTSFPFDPGYFRYTTNTASGAPVLAIVLMLPVSQYSQLSYLPDGSLLINAPSTATYSQFKGAGGLSLGSVSLTSIAADSCAAGFDVDYETSTYTARDTSIAMLEKSSDVLLFIGSTGNSVNGAASLTTRALMDLSNGYFRFGGSSLPSYPVDVTGDINVSGGYRVAGSAGLAFSTVTLAKLTTLGSNGSLGILGGVVVSYTPPT